MLLIRDIIGLLRGEDRFIGVGQAAKELHVSPRTLYRRIREGSFPAYKMGGIVRVSSLSLQRQKTHMKEKANAKDGYDAQEERVDQKANL